MKSLKLMALACALLITTANVTAQPRELLLGEWEYTMRYHLIGIPQSFPEFTIKQCLTKDRPFPGTLLPNHDECSMSAKGSFGRTHTWLVNCSSDWEMVQGMGRIHYFRDTARGDVHMQVLNPHNPPQPMVFRIRGKYLGPCKE